MLPIFLLYKDIYDERWGDLQDSGPAVESKPCPRPSRWGLPVLAGIFRRRRKRVTAWSFTLPIDRRWR